jgi:hypothetical protein
MYTEDLIQSLRNEAQRATVSQVEKTLLDLQQLAMCTEVWAEMSGCDRSEMFADIRAMIELKRTVNELEKAKQLIKWQNQ